MQIFYSGAALAASEHLSSQKSTFAREKSGLFLGDAAALDFGLRNRGF